MKIKIKITILITCITAITCFGQNENLADNSSFKNTGTAELLSPVPDDFLKITNKIVYSQNNLNSSVPWVLVTDKNPEQMQGVFEMTILAAYASPPDYLATNSDNEIPRVDVITSPVITDNIAYLKYNLQNGFIQKGDYITISNEPGVGMKATEDGFTVGVALESSDATEKSGLLRIRVMVRYEKLRQ